MTKGGVAEAMNTSQTVYAELSEDGTMIEVFFKFDEDKVKKMRKIAGAKFRNREYAAKRGHDPAVPYWDLPPDLGVGAQLREQFGEILELGPKVTKWGNAEKKQHESLAKLSKASTAKLKVLPKRLPKLNKYLRPYQKAGAAFISTARHPLIADQPGLGKTCQTIAGLFDSGVVHGPCLVVAPKVSLVTVWERELKKHQPYPVWVATGNREQREDILSDFYVECVLDGKTGWLVVNPTMCSYKRIPNPDRDPGSLDPAKSSKWLLDEKGNAIMDPMYNTIGDVEWATVVIDECHKNAIRNPATLTARGLNDLKVAEDGKKVAISGTPMDIPIHLWGILHWLHPEKFTSKWKWAEQWLQVSNNGFGYTIGGIRPGMEKEFYRSLDPYILRRLKSEVFTELPPIQFQDVWVQMDAEQRKQYEEFKLLALLKFEESNIAATNILTELLRMKQIAIAKQTVREEIKKGEKLTKLTPTFDSCKLEAVEELLDERGIMDGEGKDKVVIYSQFTEVVYMVSRWLDKKKVKHLVITGDTPDKKRVSNQDEFQDDEGPRVMLMQTESGISITLDRADTCIFIDEMWNPSDHEQAWDRLRGGIPSTVRAKDQHVTVYFIRTENAIDQRIMDIVTGKGSITKQIMDDRRYMDIL